MEYWEQNRLRKKKAFRQWSLGLPLGTLIVVAIFAVFFSGWYEKADSVFRKQDASLILVLLVAGILIVVFVVIFSIRHKWDINEQHYLELLSRKDQP